uniref:Uncharacterized protein n=1 Tax=Arundo donax TaxID=35708 RepID=A0A0A9G2B2_ARUDO
MRIKFFLLVIT